MGIKAGTTCGIKIGNWQFCDLEFIYFSAKAYLD